MLRYNDDNRIVFESSVSDVHDRVMIILYVRKQTPYRLTVQNNRASAVLTSQAIWRETTCLMSLRSIVESDERSQKQGSIKACLLSTRYSCSE